MRRIALALAVVFASVMPTHAQVALSPAVPRPPSITLGPFFASPLPTDGSTRLPLMVLGNFAGFVVPGANDVPIRQAAHVVGVLLQTDNGCMAGTATARVLVNGVAVPFASGAVTIDATHPTGSNYFTLPADGVSLAINDEVGIEVVTSSYFPVAQAFSGWLVVQID